MNCNIHAYMSLPIPITKETAVNQPTEAKLKLMHVIKHPANATTLSSAFLCAKQKKIRESWRKERVNTFYPFYHVWIYYYVFLTLHNTKTYHVCVWFSLNAYHDNDGFWYLSGVWSGFCRHFKRKRKLCFVFREAHI